MGIRDRIRNKVNNKEIVASKNSYLENPNKALALITQILAKRYAENERATALNELEELIKVDLPTILENLQLPDVIERLQRLEKLGFRLGKNERTDIFQGRKVVGLGGLFSAGKSSFINGLINGGSKLMLPENQSPTTSILTYVMAGAKDKQNVVVSNQKLEIDADALQALSHEFEERYHLSLSRFIDCITIETTNFPAEISDEIVLLDTPGFNKSTNKHDKTEVSDREIAFKQLVKADYLIWLVNAEAGAIKEEEVKFLAELDTVKQLLVVFTRADKRDKKNIQEIIRTAEQTLADHDINFYAVTAYDSRAGKEFDDNGYINNFFKSIATEPNSDQEQDSKELSADLLELEAEFANEMKQLRANLKELTKQIKTEKNILATKSLASLSLDIVLQVDRLGRNKAQFINLQEKIKWRVKKLEQG